MTAAATSTGSFWVGAETVQTPAGSLCRGPMFVHWERPEEVAHPYPIVLVHGGGGQGTDYLTTPDGRPGWAPMLAQQGFEVYVVDRPGHGRSPMNPEVMGPIGHAFPLEAAIGLFRPDPVQEQWPGTGGDEDPVLLQFLAGTGPLLADFELAHALEGERGAQLLDRIGEAILISHSAGGPTGWMTTDARPDLVKAHVAIEVMGPPFQENPAMGWSLRWGLTAAPLTYDPAPADPAELLDDTPRVLTGISRSPIAVVTAPQSPFAAFDHELVAFLERTGCDVELVRLAERGVHGNGHAMMWERNNGETLGVITDWLDSKGLT